MRLIRKPSIGLILPPILAVALVAMWLAPSAFAHQPPGGSSWNHPASSGPTGPYAPFADCPLSTPTVYDCLVGTVNGGQLTFGRETVPIDRTIMLQGGLAEPNPETENTTLAPPVHGQPLSPTPQEVPGGLRSLLGFSAPKRPWEVQLAWWLQHLNAVTATLELVGTAQVSTFNLLLEEGPALVLPVRLRLQNPLLGDHCYIGSVAEPLVLPLTDGTTSPPPPNLPISGNSGALSIEQEGSIAKLTEGTFVNNEIAVPEVNGCGLFGQLDGLLDHGIGLPSPAGANTAIINASITLAAAGSVRESEQ
jgi:hypothetical protein